MKAFIKGIFSDNGSPSCSRITSFSLSAACMVMLLGLFHHLTTLPPERLAVWLPNMPTIIAALAVFTQAPYGLNQVGNLFGKLKKEKSDADAVQP